MSAMDIKTVDWLTRSDAEVGAVMALAEAVEQCGGWFCVTRMDPGPRSPDVSYWASVSAGPDVQFTERASTPTAAARAATARLSRRAQ